MACRKRQVTIDQIETLITGLEAELRSEGIRIVSSQQIGDFLMQRLRQMDHVAYVRFASIYRDFKDPEEFVQELRRLQEDLECLQV